MSMDVYQPKKLVYDGFLSSVKSSTGPAKKTSEIAISKLDKLWLRSGEERGLRENYKESLKNFENKLQKTRTLNNIADICRMNREINEAYEKLYNDSMALSTKFSKSRNSDKRDIAALIGRDLSSMVTNRGLITNAVSRQIDSMRMNDGVISTSFDNLIRATTLLQLDTSEYKQLGKGQQNEVFKTKIGVTDLIVKKGKKDLTEERSYSRQDYIKHLAAKDGKLLIALKPKEIEEYGLRADEMMKDQKGVGQAGAFIHSLLGDFSPDMRMESKTVQEQLNDYESKNRIIPVDLAFRDQGVGLISKMMGVDCVVSSQLAFDDKTGYVSAMNQAPGKLAAQKIGLSGKDEIKAYADKFDELKNFADNPACPEKLASRLKEINREEFIDLSDPSLQKASQELAAVDFIAGNIDRHNGNFFVDGKPGNYKLIGIDNDSSFGFHLNSDDMQKNSNYGINLEHAFLCMTKELKDKIMSINEEDLGNALYGVISRSVNGAERIEAAKKRLAELKQYITTNKDKEGFLIEKHDKNSFDKMKKSLASTHCGALGMLNSKENLDKCVKAVDDNIKNQLRKETEHKHNPSIDVNQDKCSAKQEISPVK